MDKATREIVWRQFGASLDMLENAMRMCPQELWDSSTRFWYIAYHVLFWTDYYLTPDPATFVPIPPFRRSASDNSEYIPESAYSKEALLSYLQGCRSKLHSLLAGFTEELATRRWVDDRKDYPFLEILLYNMRHVQHHAAQLNLLLRQGINDAPRWVGQTKEKM